MAGGMFSPPQPSIHPETIPETNFGNNDILDETWWGSQYLVSSTLALLFFFFRFSDCTQGSSPRGMMSFRIQGTFCLSVRPSICSSVLCSGALPSRCWPESPGHWDLAWGPWPVGPGLGALSWGVWPGGSSLGALAGGHGPTQRTYKISPVYYRTSSLWGRKKDNANLGRSGPQFAFPILWCSNVFKSVKNIC